MMNAELYMSSDEVTYVYRLTAYHPTTLRKLAEKGELPVAYWEPMFRCDEETVNALKRLKGRFARKATHEQHVTD